MIALASFLFTLLVISISFASSSIINSEFPLPSSVDDSDVDYLISFTSLPRKEIQKHYIDTLIAQMTPPAPPIVATTTTTTTGATNTLLQQQQQSSTSSLKKNRKPLKPPPAHSFTFHSSYQSFKDHTHYLDTTQTNLLFTDTSGTSIRCFSPKVNETVINKQDDSKAASDPAASNTATAAVNQQDTQQTTNPVSSTATDTSSSATSTTNAVKNEVKENNIGVASSTPIIENANQASPTTTVGAQIDSPLIKLNGTCIEFYQGYWTYQICPFQRINQYHLDERSREVSLNISLGTYSAQFIRDIDVVGESDIQSHHEIVQEFVRGTDGRVSTVKFICYHVPQNSETKSFVASMKESPKLTYKFLVRSSLACDIKRLDASSINTQIKQADTSSTGIGATAATTTASNTATTGATAVPIKLSPHEERLKLIDPLRGHCVQKNMGWWTFEVCFHDKVRQFHVRENGSRDEFILGISKGYEPNPDEKSVRMVEIYEGGTPCDLTGRPRTATVIYECFPNARAILNKVHEKATCNYELHVGTSYLCPAGMIHDFSSLPGADSIASKLDSILGKNRILSPVQKRDDVLIHCLSEQEWNKYLINKDKKSEPVTEQVSAAVKTGETPVGSNIEKEVAEKQAIADLEDAPVATNVDKAANPIETSSSDQDIVKETVKEIKKEEEATTPEIQERVNNGPNSAQTHPNPTTPEIKEEQKQNDPNSGNVESQETGDSKRENSEQDDYDIDDAYFENLYLEDDLHEDL